MTHSALRGLVFSAIVLLLVLLGGTHATAQKYGGVLHGALRENPTSLSIHEEASISVVWPLKPAYNNLLIFNPAHPMDNAEDLVGELAESWAWSDGGKRLTLKLRRGVTWHDGRPFTSADVKHTFDLLRGVAAQRFKLNPRKGWYDNVAEVAAAGDFEAAFVLKRPQPALLSLLASGYTPVYPQHVDPAQLRTHIVGTGPFRLKAYLPDERLELERNPKYFMKGRPYLAGIVWTVIKARPARTASLQAGQMDIAFPSDGTAEVYEGLHQALPQLVVRVVSQGTMDNVIFNTRQPPFDNLKLRQAVNLALDRSTLLTSIMREGAVLGGVNLPQPYGAWGLPASEQRHMPGFGDGAQDRARARALLAEAGYGPGHPLQVTISTRALDIYMDQALWVTGQLKRVGIEAKLEQVESGPWFGKLARRDFQIGTNLTGFGTEDPDANFFENYACGSTRNYSDYCNPEVQALMERASAELDRAKRRALVWEIDRRLQTEVARSVLAHRIDHFMYWPHVKGLVPRYNQHNWGRMDEVWLEK